MEQTQIAIEVLRQEIAEQCAGMRRAHGAFRQAILHRDPNPYYDTANISVARRMVGWYIGNIRLLRRVMQRIEHVTRER